MTTVREFLTKYNEKKGYAINDSTLIETMTEVGKVVHRGGQDRHRWYICETVVTEIDGTFIQYTDYIIAGDNSMDDMGLEYDLDNAKIVERKFVHTRRPQVQDLITAELEPISEQIDAAIIDESPQINPAEVMKKFDEVITSLGSEWVQAPDEFEAKHDSNKAPANEFYGEDVE